MVRADSGRAAAESVAMRLAGRQGHDYVELARTTVRSVARGILGVALIQSILAGLGFLAVGIPGAGLLALICLFLSVIQVGPGLVVVGTIIYVFSVHETTPAMLYAVWGIFVSLIDNFSSPYFWDEALELP